MYVHPQDLNYAGLATLSFLGLFFPGIGLFGRRRQRIEARKAHIDTQVSQLVIEETKRLERNADHICEIDVATSRIEATPDGHVFAKCEVCDAKIYIGHATLHDREGIWR
jgi:hypothetical protein